MNDLLAKFTIHFFSLLARTRTKDKYRIVYSDHQRLELEKEFHYSRYITIRRKAELANMIGLSERQVCEKIHKIMLLKAKSLQILPLAYV